MTLSRQPCQHRWYSSRQVTTRQQRQRSAVDSTFAASAHAPGLATRNGLAHFPTPRFPSPEGLIAHEQTCSTRRGCTRQQTPKYGVMVFADGEASCRGESGQSTEQQSEIISRSWPPTRTQRPSCFSRPPAPAAGPPGQHNVPAITALQHTQPP
ncbi:uncharacterized protein B0I36DRAFT_84822 [Microdochium trichocladiopsis]|uniref:Uncharacterized protein n=1 Tax=Microdochium trichocladiopsis TaxID=1682393 RepID=A0A9P8YDB3_9PEZI|nr:uncharacterized protein B0I36DRAFT_84822 [Microdochium trichocladiopsis]KAH7034856.1 hypothetical protein B0I36DRAFT_84822 [Microdochium trichocladiopsis]